MVSSSDCDKFFCAPCSMSAKAFSHPREPRHLPPAALLSFRLVSSRLVLSCPVLLCLVLFCLGRLGGHLAPFLVVLGVVLDRFRLSWEVFWLSWGVLASSWGVLERLGVVLGAVCGPKPTNPSPTGGLGSVFGSSWAPKTTPRRVQDGTLAPQDGPRGRQDGAQDE